MALMRVKAAARSVIDMNRTRDQMPVYSVRFRTHSGEIYSIRDVDCIGDEEALKASLFLNVPSIGNGFELWHGERLVAVYPQPAKAFEG